MKQETLEDMMKLLPDHLNGQLVSGSQSLEILIWMETRTDIQKSNKIAYYYVQMDVGE